MTNEEHLASLVREELTQVWADDGRTVVRVSPRGAFTIRDLAEQVNGDDEEEAADLVYDVRGRLLDFEWQSLGPMVWNSHLDRWDAPGGTTFLLVPDAVDERDHVIAGIEGLDVDGAILRIFEELMRTNGSTLRTDWLGSLPSTFTNMSRGLITRDLVRSGVRAYVEGPGRGDWLSLRERLIEEIDEPDPLRRSLAMLESLADEGPTSWLARQERQREESRALPGEQRDMLVDAYLATSYQER